MSTLPSSPWRILMTTIRSINPETPGVTTYDLSFDDPTVRFGFKPGQFNMLYLPGIGESAISMSSDPAEPGQLRHTVRAVGNVTRALAKLKVGDKVGVRGPYGTAWPVDEYRGLDIVIATGGLGLAPLRPVIYHLLRHRKEYGQLTLLYGARSPDDLLYTGEYDSWRAGGIDVQVTVDIGSAGWHGSIGFVTTLLAKLPLDPQRTGVFTCGPEVMMRFVGAGAVNRGIAQSNVFVSLERNMNCAIGLCGHCQFGPSFVCKDGPVLSFETVQRLMLVEKL
jgi:NAD(P)H-flavin reductase